MPEAMRSAGLMRSHPLTQDRLQAARDLAQRNGWTLVGTSTPLPATLQRIEPPAKP
ncbi:MAG: hypothetical protein HC858_00305 [Brachymonas sp.]|nr:hypothetical protein [Brachymonas sp.]